jgi:hypothetical protein
MTRFRERYIETTEHAKQTAPMIASGNALAGQKPPIRSSERDLLPRRPWKGEPQ